MFLRFAESPRKIIVGTRHVMSFNSNTTPQLFGSFMPRRNEITNRANADILCVHNYPDGFFRGFNPTQLFEKWAAAEVTETTALPDGMETAIIPAGLYAVFLYKGNPSDAGSFFQNIHMNWFPSSGYTVDQRPHFDVIGAQYKKDSAESEEEIWIPIRANG